MTETKLIWTAEYFHVSVSHLDCCREKEKKAANVKTLFSFAVWILVVVREPEVHLIGAGRWIKRWRLKSWPRVSVQAECYGEVRMSNGPTVVKMTSQISPPIRDGKYLTIVQLNFVHCAHLQCSARGPVWAPCSELCFIFPKIHIYMKICFW